MPRVLFIEHKTVWGGGQAAVVNLLQEWQHTRQTIVPSVACQKGGALAPRVRALGIPCIELELGRVDKHRSVSWNLMRRAAPTLKLLEVIRAAACDVVYANGAYSFLASVFAAKLARRPIVWVEHNTTLPGDNTVRQMLQAAERIVAVCGVIRDQFTRLSRQVGPKIEVIYNGVDPELFRPSAALRALVRKEFGWEDSAPVVGTVGRLSPEKGIDYFLGAASQICSAVPHAQFLIVGDGPGLHQLEQSAAGLGLGKTVRFVGMRDDVPALLQAMDVVAFCSLNEAFPLAVLEAMAASRPVVATDVGGVSEMIERGVNGILTPARDAGGTAQAVLDLLQNTEKRRGIGAQGRARVLEQFTLEGQAARTQALLNGIVVQ